MAKNTNQDRDGALEVLTTMTLASAIYRDLERMIVEGELNPGDHINEKAVADHRGVSRGPVREACRRLEEAGLVEFKVNRGAFVRTIPFEDVLEIYQLRAVLFAFAGRVLASAITNEQIAELTSMQEQIREAVAVGDTWRFYDLNRRFHSLMIAFTGIRRLVAVYEGMDKELHLWRKRALAADSNVKAASDEHEQILDVLKNGNAARISEALSEHSLAGRNRILRAARAGHLPSVPRNFECKL